MRAALALTIAVGLGGAHAETIECPQRYASAQLVGGSMYDGPAHEYELVGTLAEVSGGQNVAYQFPGTEVKWLACWYGKGAVQWRQVSARVKRCEVRERRARGQVLVKAECK